MNDDKQNRKAYHLDPDVDNILSLMSLKTGKTRTALINDAVRVAYTKTSALSDEEYGVMERLAKQLLTHFLGENFYKNP